MSENNVNDLITDQEIAFALLVLSGKITDRQAAQAVGLNPDTAADTKSRPRVRAYLLGNQAAVEQPLVEQDTQEMRRFNVGRDQVLTLLWDIANMQPERTGNSMSAQVKSISMIVAIEGLIPDRRAVSAQKQPTPPPDHSSFYTPEWMRNQQNGISPDFQPSPAPEPEKAAPGEADDQANDRPPVSSPAPDPTANLGESILVSGPLNPFENKPAVPRVPMADYFAPDTRAPFSISKNRFGRRRP
jgi:hypothetical protein